MVHNTLMNRYSRSSSWVLVLYLSVMVSGCSFRPAEISPEEARVLQTRELNASPEDIARAVITVLQDMHYTLGTVSMDAGIITAERSSERRLAPISREAMSEAEIDQGIKTFFIVAGVIAVIGILLAWVFHDSDDNEDEEQEDHPSRSSSRHRPHHTTTNVYNTSDDHGRDSYLYTMTIMLEEIVPMQTQIRVTVQGKHLEGSRVVESGPVQTKEFYSDFYSRLDQILKY